MNETRLWYFDIYEKTVNFEYKSKHFNSKTHIHKQQHGTVVEKYDNIKPENDEVKVILNDTIEYCRN